MYCNSVILLWFVIMVNLQFAEISLPCFKIRLLLVDGNTFILTLDIL